jgi:flagellar M-ring protein FliF
MSTSQKTEDVSNSGGSAGVPGTPSNLPRSTIKPLAAGGAGSGSSRRTESMAFETSRSVRQVKMPRGSIKRVSVAVLLDHDFVWQGSGAQRKHVLTPPTAERIKAIHDIVVGVLGIQTERGDQVVIESLPFEQTIEAEEAANAVAGAKAAASAQTPLAKLLADRRVQIGAGVAILVLLLAVVFLLKRGGKKTAVEVQQGAAALAAGAEAPVTQTISEKQPDGTVITREVIVTKDGPREVREVVHRHEGGSGNAQLSDGGHTAELPIPKLALPEMDSATKMMLNQIKDHVAKDPAFAANVIRGWMGED